ncbi:MAG: hypothetical protein H6711_30875 [Myxococcales bacterium]|nr:hypothetical protein [Myxococcales bacterium]
MSSLARYPADGRVGPIARVGVTLGVAAALVACRGRTPAPPAELGSSDARRIADALFDEPPSKGRYHYAGIDDNGPAFLVHYTYERSCPPASSDPPASASAPAPAPETDTETDTEPDTGVRFFTTVIELCPTASPGGTTIEVTKADGHARPLGSE